MGRGAGAISAPLSSLVGVEKVTNERPAAGAGKIGWRASVSPARWLASDNSKSVRSAGLALTSACIAARGRHSTVASASATAPVR